MGQTSDILTDPQLALFFSDGFHLKVIYIDLPWLKVKNPLQQIQAYGCYEPFWLQVKLLFWIPLGNPYHKFHQVQPQRFRMFLQTGLGFWRFFLSKSINGKLVVWGPVVWIPGIPENEQELGFLGVPRFESQIPNHRAPNHQFTIG